MCRGPSALRGLGRAREAAPPARGAPAAPRVERLRLPGTGRALIIGRADGGLIASQPVADDAKDVSEALARTLQLAAATLGRAGLGPPPRAILQDDHAAVFTAPHDDSSCSPALP